MKASQTLWIKRIIIGTAVAALPQVLLARGPDRAEMPGCPPDAVQRGAPPPPMGGHAVHTMIPGQPFLPGVELTDAQQDAIFELMHAQAPARRELGKKADKALDELQRQGTAEHFNAKQARAFADAYAQALAQLEFNRAEGDAKLRALLTPEQRQSLAAQRKAPAEGRPGPAER